MKNQTLLVVFIFLNIGLFYFWSDSRTNKTPVQFPVRMYQLSSNEYYGTLLISKATRKTILRGDKHIYSFYGNNCIVNGKVLGRLYMAWGAEEDMGIDLGQQSTLKKLNVHVSNKHTPSYKTMLLKCTFPFSVSNAHTITLSGLPDGFRDNIKDPLPSIDIQTSIIQQSSDVPPVVNCGRQLFGEIDGDVLVRHIENGLSNGIDHFVFFDMGNANVSMTDSLQNHLSSGSASIIDMRPELSHVYNDYRKVVMDTKAGAQWLTRYECINRFYNSDWISFLDYDEFLKHPIVLNKKYPVSHIEGTHGDPREYCGMTNVSQKYLNKYSGISPSKYFIQPRVINPLRMRIHMYPGMKKFPTENHFVHHRCINSIIDSKQIH